MKGLVANKIKSQMPRFPYSKDTSLWPVELVLLLHQSPQLCVRPLVVTVFGFFLNVVILEDVYGSGFSNSFVAPVSWFVIFLLYCPSVQSVSAVLPLLKLVTFLW